jgi:uncharacterized protein
MRIQVLALVALIMALARYGNDMEVPRPSGDNTAAAIRPQSLLRSKVQLLAQVTGSQERGSIEQIPVAASCPVAGDLSGQFTAPDQMDSYLTCIIPGVEQWIDATYVRMPHPVGYFYVPHGVKGSDGCNFDSAALQYCGYPQKVYLGEDALWDLYHGSGDAAPALVLAHEVTHHFQHARGMDTGREGNAEIPYEDQADCGAGAFMNFAAQQGWLDVQSDVYDLADALAKAGEAESADRTHGTPEERLQSFDLAYTSTSLNPLAVCNRFVPSVPLVNG